MSSRIIYSSMALAHWLGWCSGVALYITLSGLTGHVFKKRLCMVVCIETTLKIGILHCCVLPFVQRVRHRRV